MQLTTQPAFTYLLSTGVTGLARTVTSTMWTNNYVMKLKLQSEIGTGFSQQ